MEAWRPRPDDTSADETGLVAEIRRRAIAWIRYVGVVRLLGAATSVVVIVGLAWLLMRQPAAPVEDSMEYATTSMPELTSITRATNTPSTITVHVAGQVLRPGVYRLDSGSRVIDAVDVAGGAAFGADSNAINLAAPLADGQRVYVPAVGEAVPVEASREGSDVSTVSFPIDINVASASDLDRLPGIGPATAEAIVRHRDERGRFASVDGLLDVPGIGEAKLAAIRGLVAV
jgi:competence protein ComEA